MRHLSLSDDLRRVTVILPDQPPLRAAAKAVRCVTFEGSSGGNAVFSYPAAADIVRALVDAFQPPIAPSSAEAVEALLASAAAIEAATAEKLRVDRLSFDAALRTEPMSQQIAAMNFAMSRYSAGARGAALLMEQGTGKSLCAVGLANGLAAAHGVGYALVVCPNSLRCRLRRAAAPPARALRASCPSLRSRPSSGRRGPVPAQATSLEPERGRVPGGLLVPDGAHL